MNVEQVIRATLRDVVESTGKEPKAELGPDTVLIDCGLDSLDFAVVVARLEAILDYDPFTMTADVVYPRTFGEFVAIYERHAHRVQQS